MRLRTYIILAILAFLVVAMWLWPEATSMLLFGTACAGAVFAFYCVSVRVFWAYVHRLER